MKPVLFFCTVFVAMLVIFLAATGELMRWFTDDGGSTVSTVSMPAPTAVADGNRLHFPFYDVETGDLSFTIDALLSQENVDIGDERVDNISELDLQDGVIEIPLQQGLELPTAVGADSGLERLTIRFDSAVWKRGKSGATQEKEPTRVLLKSGEVTANDGTRILFEDLVFEDDNTTRVLRSKKPVSIQNSSVDLRSPNGLVASLDNGVLSRIRFQPPVTAVLDSSESSLGEAAPETVSSKDGSKLAITCQGSLDVQFLDGDLDTEKLPTTVILFRQDVKMFAVSPGTEPKPDGSRFECEQLRIDLVRVEDPANPQNGPRVVPSRVLATRDGGRVHAFLQRGDETYVVDGERLEWIRPEPDSPKTGGAEEEADPKSPEKSGADFLAGEAILSGHPTLSRVGGKSARSRGPSDGDDNVVFESERALFRMSENRVIFESVRGRIDLARSAAGGGDKRRTARSARGRGPERRPGGATKGRSREEAARETSLPRSWDVAADQVEFILEPKDGRQELTGFVARSVSPDGVVVKSRLTAEAQTSSSDPFIATAHRLTYRESDRQTTLEGTDGVKPRLTRGEDWIEAEQIDLFPEDGVAHFHGDVRGHIEDVSKLDDSARATSKEGEEGKGKTDLVGTGDGAGDVTDELPSALELMAPSLEVGFQADGSGFSYLLARSRDPDKSVSIASLGEPHYRLQGRELYWDQMERRADFYGSIPSDEKPSEEKPGSAKAPASGSPAHGDGQARLEIEGGELLAREIHFDQKAWTASLSDVVTIRTFEGGATNDADGSPEPPAPRLEVVTGKADVEFFEGFAVRPGDGNPLEGGRVFRPLRRLKSLRAVRTDESRIEIRGESFVARGEEVTWDSAARQLRFFGKGVQEIEILRDDFRGPIRAREVVFDEPKDLVILRDEVHGELTQAAPTKPGEAAERVKPRAQDARPEFASSRDRNREPQVWSFKTPALEIQLRRRQPTASTLELLSVRARDKVLLQNEAQGLSLHGDEMLYEEEKRRIHIFSPSGRPQTLTHFQGAPQKKVATPGNSTQSPDRDFSRHNVDKIDAQEIWIVVEEEPGFKRRVIVDFRGDVHTSFVLSPDRLRRPIEGLGEIWTLISEELTLHIDPTRTVESQHVISRALARGKVVFQSGDWEGNADRGVYQGSEQRLTLLGTNTMPARLFFRKKQVARSARIVIRKQGKRLMYSEEG